MDIDHISAGNLLAAFARSVATAARASGCNPSFISIPDTLADDWYRAVETVRDTPEASARETLAREEGRAEARAEYDDLLDIAIALRNGVRIAFADPDADDLDDLTGDEAIAEAMGAANRLAIILIEHEGQQSIDLAPEPTV